MTTKVENIKVVLEIDIGEYPKGEFSLHSFLKEQLHEYVTDTEGVNVLGFNSEGIEDE